MNSPNHLPSASPVPVSPSNQPPSPMEDQSPPRSPKMVQSKDGAIRGGAIRDGVSRDGAIRDGAIPSANDPMDPPSKIPNNHKDLDNVAEKLMNLVLDDQIHQLNSPASPLPSFEPTKVSESISTNVHLDTPIIDEDTRSIDPVKKENVEVVADDCDDEFIDDQEPIYSHLSSFYSRDFHEISPNSHGNANIDVNPQHSFINENTSPFEDDSIFAYVGLPPLRTIRTSFTREQLRALNRYIRNGNQKWKHYSKNGNICDGECIDSQEPIYSRLSSFFSRCFHEISPNSHQNANIDVNSQHSFINENTPPQAFEEDSIFAYFRFPKTPEKPHVFYE